MDISIVRIEMIIKQGCQLPRNDIIAHKKKPLMKNHPIVMAAKCSQTNTAILYKKKKKTPICTCREERQKGKKEVV